MTLLKHELKRGKVSFLIWTAALAFLLIVCCAMYPDMQSQMDGIDDMLANMGEFTAAFGLDKLNYSEFIGFFAVECGTMLGLGGALFAAIMSISALAGEEKEHTAEFLLTSPISRTSVVTQKLVSIIIRISAFDLIIAGATLLSVIAFDLECDMGILMLMFFAFWMVQIEVAAVTFCLSAFMRKGNIGIGLGIPLLFYFINIIANMTKDSEFLKYFTPFSYAECSDIVTNKSLDGVYVAIGMAIAAVCIVMTYWKYQKKDIA